MLRWLLTEVFAATSICLLNCEEYVCVFSITKASVDISHSLVHSHVYETSAQAVMGEEEQYSL